MPVRAKRVDVDGSERSLLPRGRIELGTLKNHTLAMDDAVRRTPYIDRFCSSSVWTIPAFESFHNSREPWLFALEKGFAFFSRGEMDRFGRVLLPLESSWCLGTPLVGAGLEYLLPDFIECLREHRARWDSLVLTGVSLQSDIRSILISLSKEFAIFQGPAVDRRIASLEGGYDGFLSRRSSKFRNGLRRAQKRAAEKGLRFDLHDHSLDSDACERLFLNIMEVESRSWKGRSEQGADQGSMRDFYERMFHMLGPPGTHRVILAYQDEIPVGYIFGGLFDHAFRGLQFSFDSELGFSGLGNVLQGEMIKHLCEKGIQWYDLGTDIDYKRRWAEGRFQTHNLIMISQ